MRRDMSRLVVVIVFILFIIFVAARLVLVVIQLPRRVPLSVLVARRAVGVIHDELAAAEDGLGIVVAGDLVLELDLSVPKWLYLPYRIRFSIHGVVRGDVLYQTILDAHHLTEIFFYYWSAEIDGKIRTVVISPSLPAFGPVIFMRLLVVLQRVYGNGVEVIELAVGRIMSRARLEFWFFGMLYAEDRDDEEDKGEHI